jgi:hypothetical protein
MRSALAKLEHIFDRLGGSDEGLHPEDYRENRDSPNDN